MGGVRPLWSLIHRVCREASSRPPPPCPSPPQQTFPFLVFILAVGREGRGGGCQTSRKRLFVWLALFMPTGRRAGRRAVPPAGRAAGPGPRPLWALGPAHIHPGQVTRAPGGPATVGAFVSTSPRPTAAVLGYPRDSNGEHHCSGGFLCVPWFNPPDSMDVLHSQHPHSTDEQTEARGVCMTCPKPHRSHRVEPSTEPRAGWRPRPCVPAPLPRMHTLPHACTCTLTSPGAPRQQPPHHDHLSISMPDTVPGTHACTQCFHSVTEK